MNQPTARGVLTRVLGLAVTALTIATLPALAYATPPDQTWIHGLYDNGDHDDVVIAVMLASSTQTPPLRPRIEPPRSIVAVLVTPAISCIADRGIAASVPRGPPNT